MKILMVCLGNICRSPLAEGIMKAKIEQNGLKWSVDSAGTSAWHIGESPDPRSISIAAKNGINIRNQRARQFAPIDFDNFDLILAMDSSNYRNIISMAKNEQEKQKVDLLLNMSEPGMNRAVPDPYYDDSFQRAFDLVEKACEALITKYN